MTKEAINKYYDSHITNQQAKSQATTKPTGHIVAYHVNELWQMDILIYLDTNYSINTTNIF